MKGSYFQWKSRLLIDTAILHKDHKRKKVSEAVKSFMPKTPESQILTSTDKRGIHVAYLRVALHANSLGTLLQTKYWWFVWQWSSCFSSPAAHASATSRKRRANPRKRENRLDVLCCYIHFTSDLDEGFHLQVCPKVYDHLCKTVLSELHVSEVNAHSIIRDHVTLSNDVRC